MSQKPSRLLESSLRNLQAGWLDVGYEADATRGHEPFLTPSIELASSISGIRITEPTLAHGLADAQLMQPWNCMHGA